MTANTTARLTPNQYELLSWIAHSDYGTYNGNADALAATGSATDTGVWWWPDEAASFVGIGRRALGGVATTLTEAGLMNLSIHPKRRGEPDDSTCDMTDAGFAAWRAEYLRRETASALTTAVDESGDADLLTMDPERATADLCDCCSAIEEIVAHHPDLAAVVTEAVVAWQTARRAGFPPTGASSGDGASIQVVTMTDPEAKERLAHLTEAETRELVCGFSAAKPRRADHAEDEVIVLVSVPPAREGSSRAARYACLRHGMSVRAYLDAAHAAAPQRPRYKRHADLIRLERDGYIEVRAPEVAS